MSSITYRIATGRDAGCKVVTLQTLPGDAGSLEGEAGKVGGFSLHAGVAAEAHESHKLEKLCRYITRPAISEKRLSIAPGAGCVTSSRPRGAMAPRMWNGIRWISSPSWRRWSRHRAPT
ncbi:hypothetical protein ECZU23_54410 [Escherichia coli]|nr:hypothetical protein ECZU23_54410 [Escherichia coli]